MDRRSFLEALAVAAASGLPLHSRAAKSGDGKGFYDLPAYGNVSLLHMTDCHAQLLPVYFREPNVNLGIADARGRPPHLVGENLLRAYGYAPRSRQAHAFTFLDFPRGAQAFGRMGGFAHLSTLVKHVRASRPGQSMSGLRHVPRMTAIGGGQMIQGGGSLFGAIGVSGAPGGDADDVCAAAGIKAIADDLEF